MIPAEKLLTTLRTSRDNAQKINSYTDPSKQPDYELAVDEAQQMGYQLLYVIEIKENGEKRIVTITQQA